MTTPSSPHDRHLWQFRWVRDLFVLGFVLFVLWLGYRVSVVTVPLLVALLAAYVCEPLVSRLTRYVPRLGRTGSAVLLLAVLLLGVCAIAAMVVVPVGRQAAALVQDAPRLVKKARDYLTADERPEWIRNAVDSVLAPVAELTGADEEKASEPVEAVPPAAGEEDPAKGTPKAAVVLDPLGVAVKRTVAVVGGTARALLAIGLFVSIFLFAFVPLSSRFPAVSHWLLGLVPEAYRAQAIPLLKRMDEIISGFVRGRLLTAAILAAVYSVGWTLVGVPYAAVVGILTGLASLVPYAAALGLPVAWALVAVSAIGASEAGLYVAEEGDGWKPIWWRIVVFPAVVNVIAQVLEDYVLNPLIQGKATHLHPLAILLAIVAGGSLLGLYGMLLAVPVAACAKVVLDSLVAPALRRWAEHASTSHVDADSPGA